MPGLHPNVVIVGATGAIGSATAGVLANRGARLWLLARPSDRLDALVDRLQSDQRVSSVPVDLSVSASVRTAARELSKETRQIDALIISAVTWVPDHRFTPDGFELMAATNQLGPFLLTNLLRDRLTGGGRVIIVAAPSSTRFVPADLLFKDENPRRTPSPTFRAWRTFGATKAANLMFAFELARRAKRWDVRVNAYHPGIVRSEMNREMPRLVRLAARIMSRSPDRAAQDLYELSLSPAFDGTTGWFFKGTRRIDPPRSTLDLDAQRALWMTSAEAVELGSAGF